MVTEVPTGPEVGDRLVMLGTVVTVSVALLLVTLAAELLIMTVNWAPLSELLVAGVV